ncbi:MAG: PorT family protein [Prevotella sp.]|nr:PorT family protein [Prevotella sp.]
MKRILFILSLVLPLPATLSAQVGEHRSELAIGAGAGYVMSSVGFTPRVPQSQHGGVIAGVAARYTSEKYFNSICAIAGEVNIARIGWKENILDRNDNHVVNALTGTYEQYQRDMTYLQVPVFARLGWGRERSGFQFFFQAGPQMGVFLGESTSSNFEIESRSSERVSQIVAQDSMAVEHKFDYGIAVGLGVEFSHRRLGHFMLEGRYYYGLGDIYGNTKRDYFARSNFGNIVVKLTYLIDIRKTINPKIK